jgi:hypothetical protein
MNWIVQPLMLGAVGYVGFVPHNLNRGGYLNLKFVKAGKFLPDYFVRLTSNIICHCRSKPVHLV